MSARRYLRRLYRYYDGELWLKDSRKANRTITHSIWSNSNIEEWLRQTHAPRCTPSLVKVSFTHSHPHSYCTTNSGKRR